MSESAPKAIGYIRVSTEEQKRDGISLAAQKERIIAYCAFFKYDLIAIYQDDSTSFDMERPGLHAAFDHMKRTQAIFISIALDRLSRNIIDIEYIMDTYFGVGCPYQIHLMDCAGIDPQTRDGRMMLRFKALMAQHQVETIRDRTQQGMRYAIKEGATVGRLPYGKAYSRQLDPEGRRLVVDVPEQLATVAYIKELYAQGANPSQIAKLLQSEDRPKPSHTQWNAQHVRRILQREGGGADCGHVGYTHECVRARSYGASWATGSVMRNPRGGDYRGPRCSILSTYAASSQAQGCMSLSLTPQRGLSSEARKMGLSR